METKNFKLREDQILSLRKHYKTTGIRMSEAVRRAIDLYIESQEKKSGKSSNK